MKDAIAKADAEDAAATAPSYTNQGKGLVLVGEKTVDKVRKLFEERLTWESWELNSLVGWQFSQAVALLRKKGMPIRTVRISGNKFAYTLEPEPESQEVLPSAA